MTHFRISKINKGFKRGWYQGYWCDSSWELAFVIYNLEHNIKIERNSQGFEYTDVNGKRKRYYPDFIIDNEFIEIKGYFDEITKIKANSFPKDLKLKILYKDDMQIYLNYAIEKYGNNFWKLLSDKKI